MRARSITSLLAVAAVACAGSSSTAPHRPFVPTLQLQNLFCYTSSGRCQVQGIALVDSALGDTVILANSNDTTSCVALPSAYASDSARGADPVGFIPYDSLDRAQGNAAPVVVLPYGGGYVRAAASPGWHITGNDTTFTGNLWSGPVCK